MKTLLVLGVILGWTCSTTTVVSAEPKKSKPADRAKLLKIFKSEFIAVTPGKGKYPAELALGGRKVKLKGSFRMAKFEVPQNLYEAVVGVNSSRWKGPRNSVEMVDWNEAVAFCEKTTRLLRQQKLIGSDEAVRLPTEVEWAYVCRAGTTSAYSFGDDPARLTDYCWYKGNAKGNDPPVGAKKANPWGFYDVHGYLWEWCSDAWSDRPGTGKADAGQRVLRGGAWTSTAEQCRSDIRKKAKPDKRGADIGLRCVLAKVAS